MLDSKKSRHARCFPSGKKQGFSLIEVLIAVTLSTIALLGLAVGQLRSLQFAVNSFNYTVSIVQANNAIEETWVNLCNLQSGTTAYDDDFLALISPGNNAYTLALAPDVAAGAAFPNNVSLTISWTDSRMVGNLANQAQIFASFPVVC